MLIAWATLVLFILLMALAARAMTSEDHRAIAEALAAPRAAPSALWPRALLSTITGWLGNGGVVRRILFGVLASTLLYWYFALWVWVAGSADPAALAQLALIWVVFGIALGWPKDIIVHDQVRRLLKNTNIGLGWLAAGTDPKPSWIFRRISALSFQLAALLVHGTIAAASAALLAVLLFYWLDALELVPKLIDWSDHLRKEMSLGTIGEAGFLSNQFNVPASQAGLALTIAMTTFVPFILVYMFAMSWSITRWLYGYDRKPASPNPFTRILIVGLPLSLPFAAAMMVALQFGAHYLFKEVVG